MDVIFSLSSPSTYYPLAYVTAGSPIKSVDDLYRYITMDFSQSRAKASNVANSKYRYDNGKVFFRPAGDYQWNITGTNYFNNNDLQRTICKKLSQDSQDHLKSFSDDSFISNYTSMKLFKRISTNFTLKLPLSRSK